MAAKQKKSKANETLSLEQILFNCRDYLRGNASLNDKRDLLLTLVFLRFIGEKFDDAAANIKENLAAQGLDVNNPEILNAFLTDDSSFVGAYFLPKEARWNYLLSVEPAKLNSKLDDALSAIDSCSKALKGCTQQGLFTQLNLESSVIKKVVDEVDKISHKKFGEEKDLIGRVYEYFLRSFAINATKEDGEFYTPHDAVELIAAFVEPFDGTLYDPSCGSGGMFVQCAKYVESKQGDISHVNVYGQESDPATFRLAKMNLAVRNISYHLGEKNASTFTNDQHKGLTFDYIMANPPFNLKSWYEEDLRDDARWAGYQTPPESNANYAWILHMLSKLNPAKGVGGFLLANGALGDDDAVAIRQKLIENDKIEAIVVLPRELFYTTDISVTLWILNQNKKGGKWHGRKLRNREKEILFMDLRQWTENAVSKEQKKKVKLVADQVTRAAELYHKWQSEGTDGLNYAEPELYRSVGIDEIGNKENNWSLVPSRYIEFVDRDSNVNYKKVMQASSMKVAELLKSQKANEKALEKAFKELGYEM